MPCEPRVPKGGPPRPQSGRPPHQTRARVPRRTVDRARRLQDAESERLAERPDHPYFRQGCPEPVSEAFRTSHPRGSAGTRPACDSCQPSCRDARRGSIFDARAGLTSASVLVLAAIQPSSLPASSSSLLQRRRCSRRRRQRPRTPPPPARGSAVHAVAGSWPRGTTAIAGSPMRHPEAASTFAGGGCKRLFEPGPAATPRTVPRTAGSRRS